MKKAISLRVDKLLPGVLAIKRFLYRRLEEQLRILDEQGASEKEKRKLKIKLRGYYHRIKALERKRGRGDPPVFGELLLLLVLPEKYSENQLGDLTEEYRKRESRKGRTVADLYFYCEVIRAAWPRVLQAIWSVLKWVTIVWLSHQI